MKSKNSSFSGCFSFCFAFGSGLRKLALRHLRYGLDEMYRGINLAAQVAQLKRYIPDISVADVTR